VTGIVARNKQHKKVVI